MVEGVRSKIRLFRLRFRLRLSPTSYSLEITKKRLLKRRVRKIRKIRDPSARMAPSNPLDPLMKPNRSSLLIQIPLLFKMVMILLVVKNLTLSKKKLSKYNKSK